jgi:hypothetical protein
VVEKQQVLTVKIVQVNKGVLWAIIAQKQSSLKNSKYQGILSSP